MEWTAGIRALTFDVFGTVVDWHATIVAEGAAINAAKGLAVDWAELAEAWRAGYQPAMALVRSGALPWTSIDVLHRRILDELVPRFGLTGLDAAELADLNRVWHRLRPWPDARDGLERLRCRFLVAALSNGNLTLLANMAKQADLRWDLILSAELARHYKPDPEVYLTALDLLGMAPGEVLMVAAHQDDLRAARGVGMHTAYVHRPREYGPARTVALPPAGEFDLIAADFLDLARQLGA